MNLKEKLQQLAVERQNLIIAQHQINGAMKLLEQMILEVEPESTLPSNTKASSQESKEGLSKSKA
tara:strand:- start:8 stop:202 length:195 start_codon:yes stop_codon:yes gene_type:complete